MIRGLFEFMGSTMLLLSLDTAFRGGINQGICTSTITMAGVFIALTSYLKYDENLNFPQVIGLLFMLAAVFITGYFGTVSEDSDENYDTKALDFVMIYGFIGSLSFSLEVLFIRWLAFKGVPGPSGGFLTLFFDGLYGLTLLVILYLSGTDAIN